MPWIEAFPPPTVPFLTGPVATGVRPTLTPSGSNRPLAVLPPPSPSGAVQTVLKRPPTWEEAKKSLGDSNFLYTLPGAPLETPRPQGGMGGLEPRLPPPPSPSSSTSIHPPPWVSQVR